MLQGCSCPREEKREQESGRTGEWAVSQVAPLHCGSVWSSSLHDCWQDSGEAVFGRMENTLPWSHVMPD